VKSSLVNDAARCPACLKRLDAAFNPWRDIAPRPGDISVCAYCAAPMVFNDDLTLCALPAEGYALLPPALQRQLDLLRRIAAHRINEGNQ
jgi:hypothetical protein